MTNSIENVKKNQAVERQAGDLATAERLEFVDWLATPRKLRKPKTQAALAQKLGVAAETLSRWKRDNDLTMAVFKIVRERYVDRISDIVDAVVAKAEGGDVAAARLILSSIFGWAERAAVDLTQNAVTINIGPQMLDDDDHAKLPSWLEAEDARKEAERTGRVDGAD